MRVLISVVMLAVLAACTPNDGDLGGVGFDNYDSYFERKREKQEALRQSTIQNVQLPETKTVTEPEEEIQVAQVEPKPETKPETKSTIIIDQNNPEISDEQDFDAVSNRQSIESDAERLKAQSAKYKVIEPRKLPRRPGDKTLTPVEFALSTNHPIGKKLYRRSSVSNAGYKKVCAGYRTVDQAQDAFLRAGGPKRDRLGLDPDGDGYACAWDPGVYRRLVRQ